MRMECSTLQSGLAKHPLVSIFGKLAVELPSSGPENGAPAREGDGSDAFVSK
jgi:hypothetical protein